MTASYTYDVADLLTVRRNTVELRQVASMGEPGSGRLTINDVAGTLVIVGQKDFAADEDACSDPVTARGFIEARDYYRGPNAEGASRDIDVEFTDLNAMLGFRMIRQKTGMTAAEGGNRPSETVAARGAWLMASPFVVGLFVDNGRCDFTSDVVMDKNDYRAGSAYPGDVLADMAMAQGNVNYYVREFDSYIGPELVFRNDNTSTDDQSVVRISNVIADVNGDGTDLTFYPFKDFRLHRSPAKVHSVLAYSYSQGTVVEEDTDIADAFNGERGGTASNSYVKTAAMASTQALAMLDQHSTEEDVLEGTILVPAWAANLINHGDRMQARFSHLATEGYGEMTWFRVLEETKKPLLKAASKYELRLKLTPQETPPAPDVCNDLYPETPSGTYYALGGVNGPGSHPFGSDGVVYYWRGGYTYPLVPTPGLVGSWHFGLWGAGGVSSVDYAGDCVGNHLFLMTVGNGTWTITTELYGGVPHRLYVDAGPPDGLTSSITPFAVDAGTSFEVTIDDATDGDCIRTTRVYDSGQVCGSKWGFSQAVWVAS